MLTKLDLRKRFAVQMGGIAAATFVLFFGFAQYSIHTTEEIFVERGSESVELLASESGIYLLMQDDASLQERLDNLVEGNHAVAAGFYDGDHNLFVENALTERIASEKLEAATETITWTETTGGQSILLVRVPVANEGEVLGEAVVALAAEALQAQRRASLIIQGGVLLIVLVLAWLMLTIMRRTVVQPLEALRNAAGAVEQGDLSVRVEVDQEDEIASLAASFNAMVKASERNLEEIQQQIRQTEAAEKLMQEAEEQRQYLQAEFSRIATVIEAVTRGDLTQRLAVAQQDAVGDLMGKINGMISDLEVLIGEVKHAGSELSEAAYSVSSAAEEMSVGARDQAQQTSEVAAAVEEMSITISQSSQHAGQANSLAENASTLALKGGEVFRETRAGMERIADIVKASTADVTDLGDSSREIGEIVRVIGDIADQTNLLALNAAIEAARAGEQGRGFAVVADEVRKLAERTSTATKEIGTMIQRIQQNTSQVVESMTRGNREVEHGLELADNASHSIEAIIEGIEKVVDVINQIAATSEEQSTTSSQISHNVDTISTVADEVSRSTGDLAHTAEQMSGHVLTLEQRIARFRISGSSEPEPAASYGDGASSGDGLSYGYPTF